MKLIFLAEVFGTTALYALSAVSTGPLVPVAVSLAQEAPPAGVAGTDPAKTAAESLKSIHKFYEPKRGLILSEIERLEAKRNNTSREIAEQQKKLSELDSEMVKALKLYLAENPQAPDAAPALRDTVLIQSQLGQWADAASLAADYLSKHKDANKDFTREMSFMRADALLNLPGSEREAATALERVISDFPDSLEAHLSRARLLRALLYIGDTASALTLLDRISQLEDVKNDEAAMDWIASQRESIKLIGTAFPVAEWKNGAGAEVTPGSLTGKKVCLWYWDSTSGPSVDERHQIKELAEKFKGVVDFYAVSVNEEESVWKQFITQDKESPLNHVFEGRPEKNSAAETLGLEAVPLALLIDAKGNIHRFDVPVNELARVIGLWK